MILNVQNKEGDSALYSNSRQVTGYGIETVQTIEICVFFYRKKDIIRKNSRKSISQNEITEHDQFTSENSPFFITYLTLMNQLFISTL